jgi:hypothetical protein
MEAHRAPAPCICAVPCCPTDGVCVRNGISCVLKFSRARLSKPCLQPPPRDGRWGGGFLPSAGLAPCTNLRWQACTARCLQRRPRSQGHDQPTASSGRTEEDRFIKHAGRGRGRGATVFSSKRGHAHRFDTLWDCPYAYRNTRRGLQSSGKPRCSPLKRRGRSWNRGRAWAQLAPRHALCAWKSLLSASGSLAARAWVWYGRANNLPVCDADSRRARPVHACS